MSTTKKEPWAVLTVDVVGSTKVSDLQSIRDRELKRLSQRHLKEGRVLSRYTVTAWDEFQNVLSRPAELSEVVWDVRLAFRPRIDLKIGIGLGAIDNVPGPNTPLNEEASGEAFFFARTAVDHLHGAKEKYPLRTFVCSDDAGLDRTLNLIYMLMDSLSSNLSDRQWETIREYQEAGRMEVAAKRLAVDTSTVSRNLQRGFYWQMESARSQLRDLLADRLHSEMQEG